MNGHLRRFLVGTAAATLAFGGLTMASIAFNGAVSDSPLSGIAATVAPAAPALAATLPCSPLPGCFGSPFNVSGTPDNALAEWTGSPSLGGTFIRYIPNGYTLWVRCQANNGPQEDNKFNAPGVPSQTWDFAWDRGLNRAVWVYDWWMSTALQAPPDWYSPNVPMHCNF